MSTVLNVEETKRLNEDLFWMYYLW